MPVRALRFLRRMRGGAQAHLMEAGDGGHYVVKFTNNPQHRRILVNEWLAARFLSYLQIRAPEAAAVDLTPEFLSDNPDIGIQLGSRRTPAPPGLHFGSRFPGDPSTLSVYDFLPDLLLPKVANIREFLGALVFDKWMANSDSRQSVFFRAAAKREDEDDSRPAWIACMIDHGFVFDGPNWGFPDAPLAGLYHRPAVYTGVAGWSDFEPWLERVRAFPTAEADTALRSIPREWIAGDEDSADALIERLYRRRTRVDRMIESLKSAKTTLFPNWR